MTVYEKKKMKLGVREIDGTAHAVPFDAPGTSAQVITEAMRSSKVRSGT